MYNRKCVLLSLFIPSIKSFNPQPNQELPNPNSERQGGGSSILVGIALTAVISWGTNHYPSLLLSLKGLWEALTPSQKNIRASFYSPPAILAVLNAEIFSPKSMPYKWRLKEKERERERNWFYRGVSVDWEISWTQSQREQSEGWADCGHLGYWWMDRCLRQSVKCSMCALEVVELSIIQSKFEP